MIINGINWAAIRPMIVNGKAYLVCRDTYQVWDSKEELVTDPGERKRVLKAYRARGYDKY